MRSWASPSEFTCYGQFASGKRRPRPNASWFEQKSGTRQKLTSISTPGPSPSHFASQKSSRPCGPLLHPALSHQPRPLLHSTRLRMC